MATATKDSSKAPVAKNGKAQGKEKERPKASLVVPIKDRIHTWQFPGTKPRRWTVTTIPYEKANKIVNATAFDAMKGTGVQRQIVPAQLNRIAEAIKAGHYTPTAWSVFLTEEQMNRVKIDGDTIEFALSDTDRAEQSDGQHRDKALEKIVANADHIAQHLKMSKDDFLAAVDRLPVTMMVYLDPEFANEDFINHQKGLGIDKSQLAAQEEKAGLVDPKHKDAFILARKMAIKLNKLKDSHLYGQVRFDSRGEAAIKYSSLRAPTSSDLPMSLYGSFLVAKAAGQNDEFMVQSIVSAYRAFFDYDMPGDAAGGDQSDVPEEMSDTPVLLESGRVLSPVNLGGSKGGSMLLIAIGNILAARVHLTGRKKIEESDRKKVVDSARMVFNRDQKGNLGPHTKREMIADFTRLMFDDTEGQLTFVGDGIPSALTEIWNFGCFAISKN